MLARLQRPVFQLGTLRFGAKPENVVFGLHKNQFERSFSSGDTFCARNLVSRNFKTNSCKSYFSTLTSKLEKSTKTKEKTCLALKALVSLESAGLQIQWSDAKEEESVYPFVWLRDNCQCHSCFHQDSRSRLHLMKDLDLQIKPNHVTVSADGSAVTIIWCDEHVSRYNTSWLYERAFNKQQRSARLPVYRLDQQFWGSELKENLPTISFADVMLQDEELLKWICYLEIYGLALVTGAPTELGQVRQLAERVGFIKKTHYGEEFQVKAKPNPSNVAYSSGPLQLHADLPYYEYKPGVQFIHCVVQYQGKGGESQVVDGSHVAQEFRNLHPELFHTLSQTLVDWCDVGKDAAGEFYKVLQQPVICMSHGGKITRINFSQPQRDSFFNIYANEVIGWYHAMKVFHDLLYHPKYCIHFKLLPGMILTFDNLRVLHGRTGYMSGFGERHVEGCYIDWDEVRSKRRILQSKLRKTQSDVGTSQ